MPRIVVDRDLCQGHAVCADEAPDVFRLDDEDKVEVIVDELTPEQVARVRIACSFCPTRTIRLVEEG
jgi:ferredoxin